MDGSKSKKRVAINIHGPGCKVTVMLHTNSAILKQKYVQFNNVLSNFLKDAIRMYFDIFWKQSSSITDSSCVCVWIQASLALSTGPKEHSYTNVGKRNFCIITVLPSDVRLQQNRETAKHSKCDGWRLPGSGIIILSSSIWNRLMLEP